MPLDARKVKACLENKLRCEVSNTHHFFYNLVEDGTVIAWTKVSHNSQEIGAALESQMAKQLGVTTQILRDCVKCTVNRDQFLKSCRHSSQYNNPS